jgi:hypothetical protein
MWRFLGAAEPLLRVAATDSEVEVIVVRFASGRLV